MRPIVHIVSGAVMASIAWAVTKNMKAALWCGLGNIISDTDHLLEYGVYCLKRRSRLQLREFLSGEYFCVKGTLMVVFHGHEHLLALIFACICLRQQGNPSVLNCIALTVGYGMHMLLDLIGNDCGFKGYSILYRAAVKFDEHIICEMRQSRR